MASAHLRRQCNSITQHLSYVARGLVATIQVIYKVYQPDNRNCNKQGLNTNTMTTVNVRPVHENGLKDPSALDGRLDALLSRMDRLATSVEKSGVTIYQRRLNTSDIANPGERNWPCSKTANSRVATWQMASASPLFVETAAL